MTDQTVVLPSDARATQTTQVEQARAVAEVRAAIMVAQEVPRDVRVAEGLMLDTCGRPYVASRAFYQVPNRGSGITVHLARELARIWQNVDYGVRELHRDDSAGMSEVQAWAWDVQANVRSSRTFQVPHAKMKGRNREKLVDLDDVYRNNQNVGAKAVRECIVGVLPDWFVAQAAERCQETLRNGGGVPLPERIAQMVATFAHLGVTVLQLEERLGRKRGQWTPADLADAFVIHGSIVNDGVAPSAFFPTDSVSLGDLVGRPAVSETGGVGGKTDDRSAAGQQQEQESDTPAPPPARRRPGLPGRDVQVGKPAVPAPAQAETPAEEEPAAILLEEQPEEDSRGQSRDTAPDQVSEVPERRLIGSAQTRMIMVTFKRLGVEEREERLWWTSQIVGHPVTSSNDLTRDEGSVLIDRLSKLRDRKALEALGSELADGQGSDA